MSKKLLITMGLFIALSTIAVIGTMTITTANETLPESPSNMEEGNSSIKNEYIESREEGETELVATASVEDIKVKYKQKLENLEAEAIEEIEQLVDLAMSDIQNFVDNGERPSLVQLYSTYYRGGTELLDDIDNRFETKYNKLTDELA
ncbi:hypothetical protein, partial [Pseudomonas sp. 2822-17]|uniref:hypothetical protein n=1 Tax=Pseudomonas sp. 2822-17 TaxID=1712678 RepID=UPI00117AA975